MGASPHGESFESVHLFLWATMSWSLPSWAHKISSLCSDTYFLLFCPLVNRGLEGGEGWEWGGKVPWSALSTIGKGLISPKIAFWSDTGTKYFSGRPCGISILHSCLELSRSNNISVVCIHQEATKALCSAVYFRMSKEQESNNLINLSQRTGFRKDAGKSEEIAKLRKRRDPVGPWEW